MKNGKKGLRLAAMFLAVFLLVAFVGVDMIQADTPYKTFTVDGYGSVKETQTAYLAHETIIKFGEDFFSDPNDLYVTDDGEIYVADSGSGRILVGDINGNLIQTIGEGVLETPRGVFVTEENKHVYVADFGDGIKDGFVYEFDADGTLLNTYGRPDNPLYGDASTTSYLPVKIAVNDAGVMYIICQSNSNGIVEISPTDGGTFLGYFGTNYADADFLTVMYRRILTDEQ